MAGNHLLHLTRRSDDFYVNVLRAHGWAVDPADNLADALRLLSGRGFSLGVMRLEANNPYPVEKLDIFLDAAGDLPWIAVVDPQVLANNPLADLVYRRCKDHLVYAGEQAASLTFALGQMVGHVVGKVATPNTVMDLRTARDAAEKQAIETALIHFPNNMTKAAAQLGISRMTLYRLLHKHGLAEEHTRTA